MDACEDVTGEHLAGITTFYPYTLYYKGITTLPPGVFAGLSSVRTLNVSYNSLGTLPSGLFSDLSSVTQLHFNNNQITSVRPGTFSGLSSVVTINLSGNRLTAVPSGAFSGLSSLLNLNLRNNQITTLPSGAFSGMSSLSTLNLNDNRLTTVPSGAFSGLSSLTQLQLQGNPLTSLPPRVFSGLPSLDWLVLSQAAPGYIEDMRGALIDMPPSLTYFYISAKLTVSLERVGDTRIKAVMPSGAPFDVQVPVTVVNGSLEDHRTTLTIPRGVVESAPVNVHREGGATGAVTANIGTLPGLPSGHASYALVKDKRLPLVIYSHPVVAGDLPMAVARVTTLNRDAMDRVIICTPPPPKESKNGVVCGAGAPTQAEVDAMLADAGAYTQKPNSTVRLSGRDSTGDGLRYLWKQVCPGECRNPIIISGANGATLSFRAPSVTRPQVISLEIKLTVTDRYGYEGSHLVYIQIEDLSPETFRVPPQAYAVVNYPADPIDTDLGHVTEAARENTRVTLDGTGSSDTLDNGRIVTYLWEQIGPTGGTLTNANRSRATFLTPTGLAVYTVYSFRLTVTDNNGETDTHEVKVRVRAQPTSYIELALDVYDANGNLLTWNAGKEIPMRGTLRGYSGELLGYTWSFTSNPTGTGANDASWSTQEGIETGPSAQVPRNLPCPAWPPKPGSPSG